MRVAWAAGILVVLVAGCAAPPDADESDDGAAMTDGTIRFDWVDPEDGEAKPRMLEEAFSMWIDGGVGTVAAQDQTIEGHDFRLRLEVRFDGTPARHGYDAALSGPGTFRFQYEEAPYWAGRQICEVSSVSEASWVKVASWTASAERFSGSFLLDFDGSCDEAPDGGETRGAVRLEDGSFAPSAS